MACFTFIIFILSLLLTTTSSTTTQETLQRQLQFNFIVGVGNFTNWANLLSQADPSFFPLAATFFIPDDTALSSPNHSSFSSAVNFLDPLLFPYHIVPRRFDFTDLVHLPTGARLPTLLRGNTLLITNNSADNFTINGALIKHPNLFQNAEVSAHGVRKVLEYTRYGKDDSDDGVTSGLVQHYSSEYIIAAGRWVSVAYRRVLDLIRQAYKTLLLPFLMVTWIYMITTLLKPRLPSF